MKQIFLSVFSAFALLPAVANAQTATPNGYQFSVDLTKATDDKLLVELKAPVIKQSKISYFIPKIVPGTYAIYNFGKFIDDFKALDKNGKTLKVEHPDANTWTIKGAKKLDKITYAVNDSWDADAETMKPLPFEPAGTNVEAGKNFVINTHGFFGYFDGMTKLPYEVTFTKPAGFFGATALQNKESKPTSDRFVADSYNALADGPIMFCKPDTAMAVVGGAKILISVYSPNGKVKAAFVREQIAPILEAQRKYLGGTLPIDRYAFIIYLTDGYSATGSYGALEHSYSSFYVLPESEPEQIAQTIRDVAAHEFFHIITPLSIHAYQIADFDFINPKMSKHLWLYEGTTEYKASHVQVRYGMISTEKYAETLGDKIRESLTTKTKEGKLKYDDALPFTEMSANVLDKYKEQYNNVYAKGTLIGACLDILLNKNSKGTYDLNKLMADLAKEYGKDKAFKDDELFDKIITLSKMPELRGFFDKYVAGKEPLPLKQLFGEAGLDYYAKKKVKDLTAGGLDKSIGLDQKTMGFFIKDASGLDAAGKAWGLKEGDVLKKWDGRDLNMETINEVLGGFFNGAKADKPFTISVERDGKPVELATKVVLVEVEKEHILEWAEKPAAAQQQLRDWWLKIQK